jgi:hypothetical protein
MREIKVGDDVIITDVRNVLGNNDKTSDSVEEYMAKVVSIIHGDSGKDTDKKVGYDWLDGELHVLKMFENNINIYDTVWVDMSNWGATPPPHESGYAVVVDAWETPNTDAESSKVIYGVRFRGSDDVFVVKAQRVSRIHEDEDTQEDTMHDKHYRETVVNPILVMQALFSHDEFIGFLKGNILKYRLRMGHKGTEEDMKADYDKLCVYEMWLDTIKNGDRIVL